MTKEAEKENLTDDLELEQENENLEADEEDQEGEESENQDEQDAEGEESEEEGESQKKDKSDSKAEKRIAGLTATIKTLREENAELNDEIKFLGEELQTAKSEYNAQYPSPLKFSGKPIADLTVDEYRQALSNIKNRSFKDADKYSDTDILDIYSEAVDQREAAVKVKLSEGELNQKQHQRWVGEWTQVEKALTNADLVGEKAAKVFAANAEKIRESIQEEMDSKKFYRKTLMDGDVEVKFEQAMKHIKKLGLDKKAQLATYKEDRPSLSAPVGKPSRSTPGGSSGKPTFTRAQIDKMSLKEYMKNEKAIDEAMAAGRIK